MTTDTLTFCCMPCRLLQLPTTECRECGEPLIAALKFEPNLLRGRTRPQKSQRRRDNALAGVLTAGYLGTLAAGAIVSAVLPIGIFIATSGATAYAIARRRDLVTVPLLPPATAKTAVKKIGIARRLSATLSSLGDGERLERELERESERELERESERELERESGGVLAEEAIVRGKRDGVLLRSARSVRFLVEIPATGDGQVAEAGNVGTLVVDGLVRLAVTPNRLGTVATGDARLAALGVESDMKLTGELELLTLRDGDRVEVIGEPAQEVVQELAFDRDAGQTSVMRGREKAVVLVRVLAAPDARRP